jgi:hypothetical protein
MCTFFYIGTQTQGGEAPSNIQQLSLTSMLLNSNEIVVAGGAGSFIHLPITDLFLSYLVVKGP